MTKILSNQRNIFNANVTVTTTTIKLRIIAHVTNEIDSITIDL